MTTCTDRCCILCFAGLVFGMAAFDHCLIGLSALASLSESLDSAQSNSYSETARLARYLIYSLFYFPFCLGCRRYTLAQDFYGLAVIGLE
jgi:hypothetical protein